MRIIDLIAKLQALRAEYDDEYLSMMGEPEIMVDRFKPAENHTFHYAGFDNEITIEKTQDGVYDIISGFANETQTNNSQAPQFPTGPKP